MASKDFPLASWETFAPSWDKGMGDEGNDYFRFLELPILEKLIGRLEECRAIDLATGNGLVARWLAQKAASVIATDGAVSMIDRAKARTDTSQYGNRISFYHLDVTKQSFWDTFMAIDACLMDDGFDVVTMNMALMDIQDLGPLARSLRLLLKPNGCFVATLLHPLLFTSGAARQIVVHEKPETGQLIVDRSIVMSKYLNVPPARQLVFEGETESPYLFHRPLNQLFAPFFQAGLAVDALEETNFDESFCDPLRVIPYVNTHREILPNFQKYSASGLGLYLRFRWTGTSEGSSDPMVVCTSFLLEEKYIGIPIGLRECSRVIVRKLPDSSVGV